MALKKTINNEGIDYVGELTGSFFTGVDNEVDRWLDPYVNGYAFIYWVSLPSWFEKDEDLKHFKRLSQVNFRSFSGISPFELQTAAVNTGFANHEMNVVTGIQRGNTDFTIGHKEYSGGVMRKMYQKWISLIRDPRTGIALYPKLFDVDYGARNHSAQLLYIVVRPDVNNVGKNIVEYAAFYSNVIPTNVPLDSLYNFEIGSQDSPVIDINFKGFPEIGPNVDAYAQKILREQIMSKDGDAYIPFVDSLGANTEDISAVNWGTSVLSEIYKDESAE
jgi:hypothetical protein